AREAAAMSRDELTGASEGPALGHDPFSQGDGTLPYLIRLRERSVRRIAEARAPAAVRAESEPIPQDAPDLGPPVPELPSFDDRDESAGALDRLASWLLTAGDEERLAQIATPLGGRAYDEFGMSPRVARRALAFFKLVYRYWFRVESSGHAAIPEKEGAILAA